MKCGWLLGVKLPVTLASSPVASHRPGQEAHWPNEGPPVALLLLLFLELDSQVLSLSSTGGGVQGSEKAHEEQSSQGQDSSFSILFDCCLLIRFLM